LSIFMVNGSCRLSALVQRERGWNAFDKLQIL
jgi:hypothetical protein